MQRCHRWLVATAALLAAACSPDSERLRSIPSGGPACVRGTFIGSMTVNCPEPMPADLPQAR